MYCNCTFSTSRWGGGGGGGGSLKTFIKVVKLNERLLHINEHYNVYTLNAFITTDMPSLVPDTDMSSFVDDPAMPSLVDDTAMPQSNGVPMSTVVPSAVSVADALTPVRVRGHYKYIWLYLGLITLIWAYLPSIALILPYLPLFDPKIPLLSIFSLTYLYLPLFTYIWLYLGLITLIWAYLSLIALILPYVPYSPYIYVFFIETAPLCKILEQSDQYSWRYCILKIWGIQVSSANTVWVLI